jgi:hypothetical protein
MSKACLQQAAMHRWAQSAMDQWIDTDSIDQYYYRSILLIMLYTKRIDPSVKNFRSLTDGIDHR